MKEKMKNELRITYSVGNQPEIKATDYKDIKELWEVIKKQTNERLKEIDYNTFIKTWHNGVLLKGTLLAYSIKTRYKTVTFRGYQILHSEGKKTKAANWEELIIKLDNLLAKNPTHPVIIWGSNIWNKKHGELILDNGSDFVIKNINCV